MQSVVSAKNRGHLCKTILLPVEERAAVMVNFGWILDHERTAKRVTCLLGAVWTPQDWHEMASACAGAKLHDILAWACA